MRLRSVRGQLNRFLPGSFRSCPLACLRIEVGQVQVGGVRIGPPVENAIQLCCFAQGNHIARLILQDILVLVKCLLPLLHLHVAKPHTATGRRIFWELCQRLLILPCRFRPLAFPAMTVGGIDRRAKNLAVPRHARSTFLKMNVTRSLQTLMPVRTSPQKHASKLSLVKTRVLQKLNQDTFLVLKYLVLVLVQILACLAASVVDEADPRILSSIIDELERDWVILLFERGNHCLQLISALCYDTNGVSLDLRPYLWEAISDKLVDLLCQFLADPLL